LRLFDDSHRVTLTVTRATIGDAGVTIFLVFVFQAVGDGLEEAG